MLITGDLHFGLMSDSPINRESDVSYSGGTPWRLHDSVHLLKEMINDAAKHDQLMVICGDIFDSANPSIEVVNIFLDCLQHANYLGVLIYLFAGNHDVKNDFAATELLRTVNFDNICVVEDGTEIFRPIYHQKVLGVFKDQLSSRDMPDPKLIQMDVDDIRNWLDTDICPILFSHGTPEGMFGKYEDHEKGNSLIYSPSERIYGTDVTFGKFFKFVFLGHIHQHYKRLWNGQWIISPGSPLINDFGERNDQKGYIRFDLKTKEWDFIPFTYKQKEYTQAYFDLTESNKIHWNDALLSTFQDKVIKVIISTKNYLEVPEKEIKEKLNSVGDVVKFETRLVGEQRSRIVEANATGIQLNHYKLLEEWVSTSLAIPNARKGRVLSLGKRIIGDTDA